MRSSQRRRGFTVVELLTVVAIIAILASIVFPVASSVKSNARRSQAISNMRNVGQSLALYKLDERAFPPALGYYRVSGQTDATSHLAPEYLKNNSDLQVHGTLEPDDPNVAIQPIIGSPNTLTKAQMQSADPTDPIAQNRVEFLSGDAMDGFYYPPGTPKAGQYELRYTRYRPMDKNDPDYKRQLRFRYPPEDTVVTWISQFRTPSLNGGEDLVLFLNGEVQRFPVSQIPPEPWRVRPRQ
ncbi:MAG TPA: type II secretion system protein [Armatimonadota bacterium]|jgi:prepilin-type N-terminal cleavage/methylation domain-containing protein